MSPCEVARLTSTPPAPTAQGARAARRRPECIELLAPWRLPDRRARPPRPGAGGRVSGLPRRAMGYRRDADLGPSRDRSRPAPSGVTTEWPAVRVHARGGGGGRAGIPLQSLCLTQRRELRGRVHSRAHQLAERALLRAACGRRGEHVFGRLRSGSDGTCTLRSSVCRMPRIWLQSARCGHARVQAILQSGRRQRRGRRKPPPPIDRAHAQPANQPVGRWSRPRTGGEDETDPSTQPRGGSDEDQDVARRDRRRDRGSHGAG
jgi:hypothetical protein